MMVTSNRWIKSVLIVALSLGSLTVSAFTVSKITPVNTAKEGRNFFRVEAVLGATGAQRLRPGMEGVGKIYVEERRLIWIWTRQMVNWFKLKAWAWLP